MIEGAEQKICFDRFHVASHFGKALDKVRATEHRELCRGGTRPLTRTTYDWLRWKANGGYRDKRAFLQLTRLNLKTARAWRIKETAVMLGVTKAAAESSNAKIQKIKAMACGFRNRARFRIAILFHKGGLSMLPAVG